MNSWSIMGRLGHAPRVRTIPGSGDPVLNLSVAVERPGKPKEGEKPLWIDVTMFGKRGFAVAEFLTKGSRVAAAGAFNLREYTDKDGVHRTQPELVARDIWLVDSKGEREQLMAQQAGAAPRQGYGQPGYGQPAASHGTRPGTGGFGGQHRDDFAPGGRAQGSFGGGPAGYNYGTGADDDIPF